MEDLNFSKHALIRLHQRTSCLTCEVQELLRKNWFVELGTKPGTLKEHILFYSPRDEACFILVRSSIDGLIITVLPIEYHANLAWQVTDSEQEMARKILIEGLYNSRPKPSTIIVSVSYLTLDQEHKVKTLKKIQNSEQSLVDAIANDALLQQEVSEMCRNKEVYGTILSVNIRLGRKGLPTIIEFDELILQEI